MTFSSSFSFLGDTNFLIYNDYYALRCTLISYAVRLSNIKLSVLGYSFSLELYSITNLICVINKRRSNR